MTVKAEKLSMGTPDRGTLWNVLLTAVFMALLGMIGVMFGKFDRLEEHQAQTQATRFTSDDAAKLEAKLTSNSSELRADLTIQLTEVDKRLSLMDNDSQWLQKWVSAVHPEMPHGSENIDLDSAPAPPEVMEDSAPFPFEGRNSRSIRQSPQYDLRSKSEKLE
jgi:hypothetical protein